MGCFSAADTSSTGFLLCLLVESPLLSARFLRRAPAGCLHQRIGKKMEKKYSSSSLFYCYFAKLMLKSIQFTGSQCRPWWFSVLVFVTLVCSASRASMIPERSLVASTTMTGVTTTIRKMITARMTVMRCTLSFSSPTVLQRLSSLLVPIPHRNPLSASSLWCPDRCQGLPPLSL